MISLDKLRIFLQSLSDQSYQELRRKEEERYKNWKKEMEGPSLGGSIFV